MGECVGECVGGWVLGKWEWWWQVSGVGDWCVGGEGGRGSVGELRKVEVVSKVSVATQSNLQKQSPAKHAKIEVRKRKYSQKKKTTFC